MSTSTARALLVLPDPTESYSVGIVNANMAAIDGHLGAAPFTSSTRPASAFSGRIIRETDTEKLYYSKGTAPISASWVQIFTAGADVGLGSANALTFGGDTTINRFSAGVARTPGSWRVEGNETVIGTTTASGAVTMNSSLTINGSVTACGSLTGFGGVWSTWSPTLTNVTLGTGSTVVARYLQVGKLVLCQLQIILGTTADVTGTFTVSLPVTARALQPSVWGGGVALDQSVGSTGHRGVFVLVGAATNVVTFIASTGGTVNASVPFDWTDTDQLRVSWFYEAA